MKIFENLADLSAQVGQVVGSSEWITITQAQIQQFADATGDQQWIHTDPERAQAGPFGATIAHGFLTLSLLPQFFEKTIAVKSARMAVNYGLNKVRFLAPVPVNSRLRAHFKLVKSDPIEGSGLQMLWEMSVELEGQSKPVCIAESVLRQYE
jgi:acyl dehydratase